MAEVYTNQFTVTISGTAYTAGDTSLHVSGAAPSAVQTGTFRVRLGNTQNTILKVTAGAATTTWTVVAEANDASAALGVTVYGCEVSAGFIDGILGQATGLNGVPLDTTVTWTDGMTLQYNATTGKLVPVFDRATRPVSAIAGRPSAGQLVMIYTAEASEVFPANFASPNSYGTCGTNPTSTAVYTVYKNTSTTVGTISISTSGVFTFATTSGASFALNAGDRLTIIAPGSQDATLADVGITLVGSRGTVSAALGNSQTFTWRGAWSSATAYNAYDVVGSVGSSYICILGHTNHAPPNSTYWNVMAQNGTLGISDVQQDTYNYAADTGSANAYAISLASAPSLIAGSRVKFKATNANTGASTLAVNGGSAIALKKGGSNALAAGDIAAGQIIEVAYDGTNFQLLGGGSGGSSISLQTNGTTNGSQAIQNLTGAGLTLVDDGSGNINIGYNVPALAGFTWLNQGSSTAAQTVTGGPILLTVPDGTLNWRGLVVNQPSTPYKVQAQLRMYVKSFVNSQLIGLYFYDGTKLMGLEFLTQTSGAMLRVEKITNVTTDGSTAANGNQTTYQPLACIQSPIWAQLRNNGTTLFFDYSFDGANFVNFFSESVGTYITPTKIGVAAVSVTSTANPNVVLNLLNWRTVGNATL